MYKEDGVDEIILPKNGMRICHALPIRVARKRQEKFCPDHPKDQGIFFTKNYKSGLKMRINSFVWVQETFQKFNI